MKAQKLISMTALALAGLLVATSCSKDEDNNNTPAPQPNTLTIAATASANANFSILTQALTNAGLVAALDDANADFTVLAPTDDAFEDLFAALNVSDLNELTTLVGQDFLTNVLLYHVTEGTVNSADITTGYVDMLGTNDDGDQLSAYVSKTTVVTINGTAEVVNPDIACSNGVIHVVDAVILPLTIYDLLAVNPDYSSLVTATQVADGDIDLALQDETADLTLFAPDDAAFDDLVAALQLTSLNDVVAAIGTDGLADVLLYHAVSGNVRAEDLVAGDVTTALGADLTIDLTGGVNLLDGAGNTYEVNLPNIQGTNGCIHGINGVLLPQ